ncbi:MAG: AI-2E family transporter [Chloroflexi bacterium]|nr:AI-2E family transporter [Chloroflexota bacterium]
MSSPLVMSRAVRLRPAIVLIAVTSGGAVAGLVGAAFAVPAVAIAATIGGYVREQGDAARAVGGRLDARRRAGRSVRGGPRRGSRTAAGARPHADRGHSTARRAPRRLTTAALDRPVTCRSRGGAPTLACAHGGRGGARWRCRSAGSTSRARSATRWRSSRATRP